MKQCSKCKVCKLAADFYKHPATCDGLDTRCKACLKMSRAKTQSEYYKQRRAEGPYGSWANMKTRCLNSNSPDFKWYGAKGVSICSEWLDYDCFKEWALANRWKPGLTIDRTDPAGNYEPSNCKWVTNEVNGIRSYYKNI